MDVLTFDAQRAQEVVPNAVLRFSAKHIAHSGIEISINAPAILSVL